MMNLSRALVLTAAVMIVSTFHLAEAGKESCPTNCLNDRCSSNKRCTEGCTNGHYGNLCNNSCRAQCLNSTCHVSSKTGSAVCISGCVDGWKGDNCEVRCPRHCVVCNTTTCFMCEDSEWYGPKCGNFCQHCKENLCHRNGTCKHGCTGLLTGPGCKCDPICMSCDSTTYTCASCPKGKFGEKCSRDCSQGCFKEECNVGNGSCTHGCVSGRSGSDCTVFISLGNLPPLNGPPIGSDTSRGTNTSLRAGTSVDATLYPGTSPSGSDDISVMGVDSGENSGDNLRWIIIITGSMNCVLVLLSIRVVFRFCHSGKKKTNKTCQTSDSLGGAI